VHRHDLEQVINLLDYLVKELIAFKSLVYKRKSKYKQKLFDVGGKLLKYISGTAIVQELNHISNIMKELYL
jgi:hypothetical protein